MGCRYSVLGIVFAKYTERVEAYQKDHNTYGETLASTPRRDAVYCFIIDFVS